MEIALVDAVAAVRDELLVAAARGAGSEVRFAVSEVLLEFAVELREDRNAQAGFRAWVLSAQAEGSSSRADTHRVSVRLTPQAADGAAYLIAGDARRPEGPGDVSEHVER
ncbi:hypothetical protein KDL01_13255 [Actinospica durhamensis]|uniref:Trypsin-co-occurring domain-containing protein n=1 Tax=Actinospica durhamensis TaxID=1508375 RepID=A0A941ITD4_9ACTN|nr:trypco2 family protein [Actinospica durhamensis]MBR7834236.1 hypothetical protein [Actinospica durhamensis]